MMLDLSTCRSNTLIASSRSAINVLYRYYGLRGGHYRVCGSCGSCSFVAASARGTLSVLLIAPEDALILLFQGTPPPSRKAMAAEILCIKCMIVANRGPER